MHCIWHYKDLKVILMNLKWKSEQVGLFFNNNFSKEKCTQTCECFLIICPYEVHGLYFPYWHVHCLLAVCFLSQLMKRFRKSFIRHSKITNASLSQNWHVQTSLFVTMREMWVWIFNIAMHFFPEYRLKLVIYHFFSGSVSIWALFRQKQRLCCSWTSRDAKCFQMFICIRSFPSTFWGVSQIF